MGNDGFRMLLEEEALTVLNAFVGAGSAFFKERTSARINLPVPVASRPLFLKTEIWRYTGRSLQLPKGRHFLDHFPLVTRDAIAVANIVRTPELRVQWDVDRLSAAPQYDKYTRGLFLKDLEEIIEEAKERY